MIARRKFLDLEVLIVSMSHVLHVERGNNIMKKY